MLQKHTKIIKTWSSTFLGLYGGLGDCGWWSCWLWMSVEAECEPAPCWSRVEILRWSAGWPLRGDGSMYRIGWGNTLKIQSVVVARTWWWDEGENTTITESHYGDSKVLSSTTSVLTPTTSMGKNQYKPRRKPVLGLLMHFYSHAFSYSTWQRHPRTS